jgi:hypothetical protein
MTSQSHQGGVTLIELNMVLAESILGEVLQKDYADTDLLDPRD